MADEQFTDAIALLKADHRTVADLFEQFEKARDDGKKQAIAKKICTELKVHTMLGSGLIGHSQKMTVAARATAEKKTVGHRS